MMWLFAGFIVGWSSDRNFAEFTTTWCIREMKMQMRTVAVQIPIRDNFECSGALAQHDWLNAAAGVRG